LPSFRSEMSAFGGSDLKLSVRSLHNVVAQFVE
jgi:hypothetical protein